MAAAAMSAAVVAVAYLPACMGLFWGFGFLRVFSI